MKSVKVNNFLSTINLILIVVGYALLTTLFFSGTKAEIENISQSVTIPYRAVCLLIMLAVIFFNIKRNIKPITLSFFFLCLFWVFWIFRIFYDLYIDNINVNIANQLWLFIFGICTPALVSVAKSINNINFELAFKWIWALMAITLIITMFSNQALISTADDNVRVDGNLALNTISFGNLGVSAFILSLYKLKKEKISKLFQLVVVVIAVLSVYSTLRAGSRGPIINLIFVVAFWFFSTRKQIAAGIFGLAIIILLLFLFQDFILNILGDISPIIEYRFRQTIGGTGDSDIERQLLRENAINLFQSSPFIGEQFAVLDSKGGFAYAHNIFLDALMALGVIGFFVILYVVVSAFRGAFFMLKNNNQPGWIGLLLVQQIVSNMFSGAFYQDQLLTTLLVIVFSFNKNKFISWKSQS